MASIPVLALVVLVDIAVVVLLLVGGGGEGGGGFFRLDTLDGSPCNCFHVMHLTSLFSSSWSMMVHARLKILKPLPSDPKKSRSTWKHWKVTKGFKVLRYRPIVCCTLWCTLPHNVFVFLALGHRSRETPSLLGWRCLQQSVHCQVATLPNLSQDIQLRNQDKQMMRIEAARAPECK